MIDRQTRRKQAWQHASLAVLLGVLVSLGLAVFGGGWFAALPIAAAVLFAGSRLHQRGAVPVIVYHSISEQPDWLPWGKNTSVRPDVFERHMKILVRRGWTVYSTEAFQSARARGLTLPDKSVMVHFDDGYLDNWVAAVPILRRYGVPATIFVSADFIDPSQAPRPTVEDGATEWRGYMNAAELRALEADPLIEIACHGADHARVPVSDHEVDRLTAENWRYHAPLFWRDAENKSRWFEAKKPPAELGTSIYQSDSALTSTMWSAEGTESQTECDARVRANLIRARHALRDLLGREIDFLCWPYDRVTNKAASIAREVGFQTLTGGRGENREGEDPWLLSRTHINDFAAGPASDWVEDLVFRAKLGVAAGHYWWMPVTAWARRRRAKHVPAPQGPGA
ncbi:MAG: polysaccharide deacetylase family protein [Donghicola eburneus]|nr:polysaccharide deacetylase family protein [Donghicola eburneus]MCI5038230.1 polysaccharide deacetylase family protein [Donghicola eburneus]